jgi:hypothetical protein
MSNHLTDLFNALQQRLSSGLSASRSTLAHPVAKGTASESNWLAILNDHLPNRYHASGAFVIDSNGTYSDQIDVVIYDRHYTPILYNQDNQRVIPAESVYAIFEVRQALDKANIEYAGNKAASVRSLARTSAPITHAGGEFKPRPPIPLLAGILAYESSWTPPFGEPFLQSLSEQGLNERIDLGCAVTSGSFEAVYEPDGSITIQIGSEDQALVHFLLRLLHRLQRVGTVTAIDYDVYSQVLNV